MKHLISRKEALKNEVFASFVGSWQTRFDPREDPYFTKAGVYYDWDLQKERFFSQEEIDELNALELKGFLDLKDDIEIKQLTDSAELKYNLATADIFLYAKELGKMLEKLSTELDSALIFLLDYSVPWLSQKNSYEPVKQALKYLKKMGVTDDFVGGFAFKGEELAEFVSHLFWIIRCNASLPYCWFSTDKHEFVGTICKHGNIHLYTYSEKIKESMQAFTQKNSLIEIEVCMEAFTVSSGIKGRQIVV